MPCYIIRRIRQIHCARGPERCAKCREMNREVISLLDICPPDPDRVARPTIAVSVGGERAWRPYDVVRTFADEAEARAYAGEHGIDDVEI